MLALAFKLNKTIKEIEEMTIEDQATMIAYLSLENEKVEDGE